MTVTFRSLAVSISLDKCSGRLCLNKGQELTNVKKKMKKLLHVEQYLSFQQRCYDNLFHYRIALSLARAA
ncbi:hypothetical protein [Paenibacillus doosanensis]|uniref:hypothetical protein n=1 Tax=Paenibacillus doosanensis TaxID=1229154 RepID=UPI00217F30C4|nr:hypothetical protein [Paenibacillus doosanensis]